MGSGRVLLHFELISYLLEKKKKKRTLKSVGVHTCVDHIFSPLFIW